MKRILIVLFGIVLGKVNYGQVDSSVYEKKVLIKWNPTSLIGYSAIQFAGEYMYKPKKSIQLEYGFIIPTLATIRKENLGHRIRFEHRNYLNKAESFYIAPEVHAVYVNYNYTQLFSSTGERFEDDAHYEDIRISKTSFSTNIKLGYQYIFKDSRFLFDVYFGLGVRYTVTRFVEYPSNGIWVQPVDNWFTDYNNEESVKFLPNLITGFKIGYRIQ